MFGIFVALLYFHCPISDFRFIPILVSITYNSRSLSLILPAAFSENREGISLSICLHLPSLLPARTVSKPFSARKLSST